MDKVLIMDQMGNQKEMEAVTIYEIPNYQYHYIIYCSKDKEHYYLGKYMGDEITTLMTDFNDEELEYANGILRGVIGLE